jgi:YidC/Oxa1 family membrane protein insertase
MFNTLIVQPILNLLIFIYALLPGHDFGVAIIIFTIIVRLLLWPLLKKQLYHTKKLRELQPEIKKIKAAAKGDRQKESKMTMELYKERKVSPFATLGLTLLQFPILIGLYIGLEHLIKDPHQLITQTYPFVRDLPWMKEVAANIHLFNPSFFNWIDLNQAAQSPAGWYFPALILVLGSAAVQYFQGKQLMPVSKDGKGLRQILQEAKSGQKADSTDMQAATGRFTSLMIPVLIFFVTLRIASALSLYWFVSGLIAVWQQARVLNKDEEELEAVAEKPVIEGEIVTKPTAAKRPVKTRGKRSKSKKRKR